MAVNASGSAVSSASTLTVNGAPGPDAFGVIDSPATQTGNAPFRTTWIVPAGSLIAGSLPSANGAGTFNNEGCGGLIRLTDGSFGAVGSAQNTTLASCGSSAGSSVTYDLAGSSSGYTLTNIVIFSGWTDKGRDGQAYDVFYSTATAPGTFVQLTSFFYNPAGPGTPTANRVTLTPASGAFGTNIVRIKINFLNAENGWSGYSEIGVYGQVSPAINTPPYFANDVSPASGSDVVGSSVTFKATANGSGPFTYQWRKNTGSGPVDISGATSSTLTLNNLQLGDSAAPGYSVQVSNAFGVVVSSESAFTVNTVPAPVNGIIAAPANQTGRSTSALRPTWTIDGGSLISGATPSTIGTGNFNQEGALGVSVLTDNSAGTSGGGNLGFATCGTGAGTALVYTLAGSASGYDLSKIIVHAGWADSGRDGQGYRIYYSTVSAPTTFIPLRTNSYNPTIPAATPSADRVTLYAANGALAQRVAAVRFEFLNVENGWSGYSEIAIFGAVSPPTVNSSIGANGKLILTGSGGSPGGSYSWLTTTNMATPLANWITNTVGVFDSNGAFSNAIPINPSETSRFFRLKLP
jgi:hypothetical protein